MDKSSSEGEDKGFSEEVEQHEQRHREEKENGLCGQSWSDKPPGKAPCSRQTWCRPVHCRLWRELQWSIQALMHIQIPSPALLSQAPLCETSLGRALAKTLLKPPFCQDLLIRRTGHAWKHFALTQFSAHSHFLPFPCPASSPRVQKMARVSDRDFLAAWAVFSVRWFCCAPPVPPPPTHLITPVCTDASLLWPSPSAWGKCYYRDSSVLQG